MTVQELINKLNTIKDKNLLVRVVQDDSYTDITENFWVDDIEVANTGQSGYELNGEVILIGRE
tara:strand:+ start:5407 stop:5595 length:189 start_codon:yes stop_codon:yes gene_type:complete